MTVHTFVSPPRPFKIKVSDADLDDLNRRLDQARWPPVDPAPDKESQEAPFGLGKGPSLELMKELAQQWRHEYDWRKTEARLNALPHFTVEIESLNIHFIHQRSQREDAIPLCCIHGWPGSFEEFVDMVPLLTNPPDASTPAFHVVVPSQPGFTFSSPPPDSSWQMPDTARVFDKLMTGLGYKQYAAQGGDWGSVTARCIGANHKDTCKAVHLNFLPVRNPLMKWVPPRLLLDYLPKFALSDKDRERGRTALAYLEKGSAYYVMQHLTPRTPTWGLNDSPIGLLSWIAEKMIPYIDQAATARSNPTLTRETLFDHVSLYWFTHSIGTSFSPYAFNKHFSDYVEDPKLYLPNMAVSIFPWEIVISAERDMRRTGNLRWYRECDQGGHFAALENPEILTEHLRDAFKVLW